MPGQDLGHYRILELLGKGGMGEVYRAEDTVLKRQVALKVLPSDFTASPQRVERFRREAESVAALDHPNIVTLYSVEEAEGRLFLTMQLVEGKSLRELIGTGGGLSLPSALEIAIALADALGAAHAKGIIHRDLKPANLMLDQDGRVRVLDFGLAKRQRAGLEEGVSQAATEVMTQEGTILGTIPYMSPKQIQGQPVDHRTDIYSLGVILHEMLSGQQPFQAANSAALMSSILRDPPKPLSQVRAGLPDKVEQILQRCLEKDPILRYQSTAQLWLDLRDVQSKIEGTGSREIEAAVERVLAHTPASQPTGSIGSSASAATVFEKPGPARPGWIPWLAAVSLAWGVLFTAYYFWFARRDSQGPTALSVANLSYGQITSHPGVEQSPSLSPDGEWVVYSAVGPEHQDIFLQSVDGQTRFNLTEDSGADNLQPAFSPDGKSIAFRSSRDGGGLFVMGRTGEAVRRVTREGFNPAWSPDGGRLAFSTESVSLNPLNWEGRSGVWVATVATGESHSLIERQAVEPAWAPSGERIAFVSRTGDISKLDVFTIPTAGGDAVAATTDPAADWSPVWAPDGHHIYFASDRGGSMNLWRIEVDQESGEPLSQPEPLTTPATYLVHPSISADGTRIAYSSVLMTQNIQKLALDRGAPAPAESAELVTSGSSQWSSVDVSADGEWLVFYSRARPEGDLYLSRSDGSGLRQLTGDEALDRVPRWSPDGEWIAFFSDRSGSLQIWKIRRDGSGLTQLTDLEPGASLCAWSPDGTRIAAVSGLGSEPRTVIFDPARSAADQTPEILPAVNDSGPLSSSAPGPPTAQNWRDKVDYRGRASSSTPSRPAPTGA